ncbi:pilus assembly protein PilP [Shewanella dokdonensis]|uniref:Pilus assembly protein PilP n=1 Tax=Shewanella dokdonensis TaxID=712036 RepID=A0ABX8DAK6_9GAMM|nr:pilus assembly protein PilP [Shewanella dokdonensis]MCL1076407.1 pilus assembly protein PilP [Shewanella dokdonensis]QVK21923.1 pilus assembly protein PilP [Shewanella dokdonensis]
MRWILPLMLTMLLAGCIGDRADLQQFVASVKQNHVARIPPLKEPPKFEHFQYDADLLRSPFVPPSRELTAEAVDTTKDCRHPDLDRRKERLETYALDNLKMRGTLSDGGVIWALIETTDSNVYRLGVGNYLGLFSGHITKITPSRIELTELIPDGSGCWTERSSSLDLTGE